MKMSQSTAFLVACQLSDGEPPPYLASQIEQFLHEIRTAHWFYENRRSRAEVVDKLRSLLGIRSEQNRSALSAYFKLAPYNTSYCSIRQLAGTTDEFEQAEWLISIWAKGKNAIAGRGKAQLPGEPHPKVLCVTLVWALLDHVERSSEYTNREKSVLAKQLFEGAVGLKPTWASNPFKSWRPHFSKASRLLKTSGLGGLRLVWDRQLQQSRRRGPPPFPCFMSW